MNTKSAFDKCLVYIGTQLDPGLRPKLRKRRQPTVTISRETGAGGMPVAEDLAAYLQSHGPKTPQPWTVFDRNLVEQALEEHNLPKELARYLPEDRVSQIRDMVEEVLGLHPPSWTMLRQTTETILHLAEIGNVILVGHGANIITAPMENVFHVRLVGSEAVRVKLVEDYYNLDHKRALAFMKTADRGRRRFIKKYFHQNIDNPMLYHLVINTDRISYDEATELIGDAVIRRFYGKD